MKLFRRTVLRSIALASLALVQPAFAREITHAMGTTDVPDSPQRIVVLTNEGTEALLAVGITPVGAVRSWLGDPWYAHIAADMADVTVVGEESAVNLETIAALQPDLIVGNKTRQEKIYDQLSAIAPTVMSERLRGDWKINMALYTDAVGKGDEGKAALDAFDARVHKIAEAAGPALQEEVSLGRFMPSLTRIYYKDTFAGLILGEIGFARPATQDKPEFADAIGKERIPELEGDRLFYYVYETGDGEGNSQAADWTSDPLWLNLDVVKAGKAYAVDDAVWNTAGGYLAANLLLDDVERIYELPATR
ncbi:iron-siderophore ABC transporter substrate-binding protein [Devosia neptuniae]|jgi:iron complex transport system substrate-binding protein|uniref:ABC transporter substrate-binding protein n=1 Tax=Devosia TaxID=46913 RepID=UPI0022B07E11|nr:iron-siderophore ABC transporter substrate-binding protein [Devosia neptuniae]MCZ4345597.1 iron-siderophore ABC transporter substrate-binding protein [Devosia neptuniae]|tara:strand:+ start:1113 stop:2033 length:921 start_codon:yes stop_codon:yes gene_type:complete